MKLLVRLIEARNIPATGPNGYGDPYVKLKLGKQKFRSTVVKKRTDPTWCEEFTFKVEDLKEELIVSVLDEDKYFNHDHVGQIKVPIINVFEAKDQSLGTSWYKLHPINNGKKARNTECGEVLLTICFAQSSPADAPLVGDSEALLRKCPSTLHTSPSGTFSPARLEDPGATPPGPSKEDKSTFANRIANMFNKNVDSSPVGERDDPLPEHKSIFSAYSEEQSTSLSFEEVMRILEAKEQQQGGEIPDPLPGGVVLDQLYSLAPHELNSMIFSLDSSFWKSTADAVGSTDLQIGQWRVESSGASIKRVVSYTRAPTRIIKGVKGIEEQTYLKGDGKSFAVLASVDTPDAPYGKTFKAEVLYCITPGPMQLSGQPSARLVVSWRINFLQSTMMKGMIESGAKQGLKDNFEQYEKILSQVLKPVVVHDVASEKDKVLASLHAEHQSDWKLVVQYLMNLTVISAVALGFFIAAHIWLAMPGKTQGLEFVSLDLPDSVSEVMVSGVLVLIGKQTLELFSRFMHARMLKGSDHGIKARGDGWLLTVALIEGRSLIAAYSAGFSDPYVVFTCNGRKRMSSTKFQRLDPLWNEFFEYDAMDEPPSLLEVEVFGFSGPFAEAKSIGRAEINFLNSNFSELSDMWIPLGREMEFGCEPKLHVRIFLENTKGDDAVKDYTTKMEKMVGKKMKPRSTQTNAAFQKLFGLPPEEFLINDFNCNLKRKMPHQGRVFVSPRTVGFHSDIFGHKIKFFFLWEDVEDIQVIPPRLASMDIIIILKPRRGYDARHGARSQDAQGRLRFHFQSFVSSNLAHRTIMAVWRARALSPEQKARIAAEESAANDAQNGDEMVVESPRSQSAGDDEEPALDMPVVYSSVVSIPMGFLMEVFNGGGTEKSVMERAGCLDYFPEPWVPDKGEVWQRQVRYRFDDNLVSHYRGEVASSQKRCLLPGRRNGWLIEEVAAPHAFTLADCFTIHLKYVVESVASKSEGCSSIQVYVGISWVKPSCKHKKKIAKNIAANLQKRFRIISSALEKEYISGTTSYR
ncbi:C2 and GRAM domain-containing protein At1g03370-like [Andrographis paniculata]|uniref:C2 and GRAM domain-containing protein At1g03370-like n=1 Tax=Andrographis paniculata TaxID=175694 RepID=UPI0021E9864D|nr:C2 and GRAM domain-containing protein At1g03370-like [Andrographis paniculata]